MRQKIMQALIYPALMTGMSLSIVMFLLIYVVPTIVDVFTSTNQSLPLVTTMLISFSSGIKHYGIYILVLLTLGIWLFRRRLQKSPLFQHKFDQFLLQLPMLGGALKTINTARFSRTVGILITAGVPLLEAMRLSTQLVANLPLRKALQKAEKQVTEGVSVHRALQQTNYFPVMSIYLIASGEASGQLTEMLERVANNQDEDVRRLIDLGLRLFEPALIIVMGAIVMFIVLAILLPIFSLEQFTG
jgi:general secretion pathway protein F